MAVNPGIVGGYVAGQNVGLDMANRYQVALNEQAQRQMVASGLGDARQTKLPAAPAAPPAPGLGMRRAPEAPEAGGVELPTVYADDLLSGANAMVEQGTQLLRQGKTDMGMKRFSEGVAARSIAYNADMNDADAAFVRSGEMDATPYLAVLKRHRDMFGADIQDIGQNSDGTLWVDVVKPGGTTPPAASTGQDGETVISNVTGSDQVVRQTYNVDQLRQRLTRLRDPKAIGAHLISVSDAAATTAIKRGDEMLKAQLDVWKEKQKNSLKVFENVKINGEDMTMMRTTTGDWVPIQAGGRGSPLSTRMLAQIKDAEKRFDAMTGGLNLELGTGNIPQEFQQRAGMLGGLVMANPSLDPGKAALVAKEGKIMNVPVTLENGTRATRPFMLYEGKYYEIANVEDKAIPQGMFSRERAPDGSALPPPGPYQPAAPPTRTPRGTSSMPSELVPQGGPGLEFQGEQGPGWESRKAPVRPDLSALGLGMSDVIPLSM